MPKILHLRKINGPDSDPPQVDWIVEFDARGICTQCTTTEGEASEAFLGKHVSFIDQWLAIGDHKWHKIVEDLSTD